MPVLPVSPVSAQKNLFLKFSSLQNSSDQEILVLLNSFFIFFGTEALITRIYVHEKLHLPGNFDFGGTRMCEYLSSVPNLWMHELQSEQFKKLFSFSVDDNFLNMLFCTETQPRRIENPEE